MIKNHLLISLFSVVLILSWSCPLPLEKPDLSIMQDLNPPLISISSPEMDSPFESTLSVTGSVVDIDESGNERTAAPGSYIKKISWYIKSQDRPHEDLELDDQGGFTFNLDTRTFQDQLTLIIEAEDLNHNLRQFSLSLDPDTEGPNLMVTSFKDYDYYSTVLALKGYVTDSINSSNFNEVKSEVEYLILGTTLGTGDPIPLSVDENGLFSFSKDLNLSDLDGNQVLQVTAEDKNGNSTTLQFNLRKPAAGGDISGFTLTPGDRQVALNWDPVDYAVSYSITEYTSGISVKEWTGTEYIWDGLDNGTLYSFQITADIPDEKGEDALSSELSEIPLNSRTLFPWVDQEGYKSISLGWMDIAGTDRYVIERSSDPLNWNSPRIWKTHGCNFVDNSADPAISYYYRIYPENFETIKSSALAARASSYGYKEVDNPLTGTIHDFQIEGNYAYLACDERGLAIMDISTPENSGEPLFVSIRENNAAYAVALSGDYAYVALKTTDGISYGGLAIINVSDPANPGLPLYVNTKNSGPAVYNGAIDLVISGDYIYLADLNDGIAAVNIEDPDHPGSPEYTKASDFNYMTNPTYKIQAIDISGGTLITCNSNTYNASLVYGSYSLFDISSTPQTPVKQRETNLTGSPTGVEIRDHYAYISRDISSGGSSGITIADISNPAAPVTKGGLDFGNAQNISLSGDIALIADESDGITMVDISDISEPGKIATLDQDGAAVNETILHHGLLFTATRESGLIIADYHFPDVTSRMDTIIAGYGIKDFYMEGQSAYCTNNDDGVLLVNLETKTIDETFSIGSSSSTLDKNDHWLIVLDGSDFTNRTLLFMDLNTPDRVYEKQFISSAAQWIIAGNYLYTSGSASLSPAILDITDPADLPRPFYIELDHSPSRVAKSGDYLFYVCLDGFLTVVDISDPENPGKPVYVEIGTTTVDHADLEIRGNYLYTLTEDYDDGSLLYTIDISNPLKAEKLGSPIALDYHYEKMKLSGDFLYLFKNQDSPTYGFQLFSCADPSEPIAASDPIATSTTCFDIHFSGTTAFIGNNLEGIKAINLGGTDY